jgi:hypothetical protein
MGVDNGVFSNGDGVFSGMGTANGNGSMMPFLGLILAPVAAVGIVSNRSGAGCLGCEESGLGVIGMIGRRLEGGAALAAHASQLMQENPQGFQVMAEALTAASEQQKEQRRQEHLARQEAQQAADQAEWESGRQATQERLMRQQAEAEQRTGMIVMGIGGVVLLSLVGGGIWWLVKRRRAAEEE